MKTASPRPLRYVLLWLSAALLLIGCASGQPAKRDQLLQNLDQMVDQGIQDARRNLARDPAGMASEILEQLQQTQRYVARAEQDPTAFDAEEMLRLTQKTMALIENLKQDFQLVVRTDVGFRLGGYRPDHLLADGKAILDAFADRILTLQLAEYRQQFPDAPLRIVIVTRGYADEIAPNKDLARALWPQTADALSLTDPERRRVLNQRLSLRRSQTINAYIRRRLERRLTAPNVEIGPPVIEGHGEALPEPGDGVQPPYRKKDPRRRICKVYSKLVIP